MTSTVPALMVAGAEKSYGDHHAVRGVSFEIAPGEVFGLLGRNGAGKSTTMEMVCGLLPIDAGSITIFGDDVATSTRQAQRRLGYSPQDISLLHLLTVRENVELSARLHDLDIATRRQRGHEVLKRLELGDLADRRCGALSGGEKRRVQLAMALVHEPRLLVLDEPTGSLDVTSRSVVLSLIRQAKAEGVSVLYTTHYLEEAEELCDRVAIIDHGAMVVDGTVESILRRFGTGYVTFATREAPTKAAIAAIGCLPGVTSVREVGDGLAVACANPDDVLVALLGAIHDDGGSLADLAIAPPDLEGAFFAVTGELYEGAT